MISETLRAAVPRDSSWVVAIHLSQRDVTPVGTGVLIDEHHVLTCAHVVHVDVQPRPELWLAFPNSAALMHHRVRVDRIIAPPIERRNLEDIAVLEFDDAVSAHMAARLRCPEPGELAGQDWWTFGFPRGDALGSEAVGTIGASAGYGWVRLDTQARPGQGVTDGFSGAPIWCEAYQAVVGIVGQANRTGDARAFTLWQADRALPDAKIRRLADWTAEAAGESALASWGWSLDKDPEAVRHWRPRARGVSRDSERGYRFRGRSAALTRIADWLISEQPQHTALVVTGSPGVGKSAVLGRIVTSADPGIAAVLPPEDSAVRAPVGSVTCAVHAKSKTALDVAVEIARAASAPIPQQTGDLAIGLARALADQQGRHFAVVIDALDEAATPKEARDIVRWIVRPLVEDLAESGVRVVVGSRRRDNQGNLITAFGAAITVVDLDHPAFFELEDLSEYALASLQLLGAERHGNPYEDTPVARPVAARIAALADGNFLVAGLIARAHGLHDSEPIQPEAISFSPKVDDAVHEFLDRIPPLGPRTAAELLTALAYAEAPGFTISLWDEALRALYGAEGSPGAEPLRDFARKSAANFLVEDTAAEGGGESERAYRLFHQALNDVLLAARDAQHEDERAIARTFIALGRRIGWQRGPAYLLRSLPGHAQRGAVMTELMADDGYPVYADLRRLIPAALRSPEVLRSNAERLRLLRKAQRAIDAPPHRRVALFSMVEAQEHLGSTYRNSNTPSAYRAAWAHLVPEEEQAVLEGHTGPVNQVAALPVGGERELLASAGSDGTLRLWDPDTGENVRVIRAPEGLSITAVCAVPNGDGTARLASGRSDGFVQVWDPETGEPLDAAKCGPGKISSICAVAYQPERLGLAILVGTNSVLLWDPAEGAPEQLPKSPTRRLKSVCAIPRDDGREVLGLGSKNGSIHIWDPVERTANMRVRGYAGAATAIFAFTTEDGATRLAVGGDDHAVRLWDESSGEHLYTLDQQSNPVTAICAIPRGDSERLLAVASGDGTIQVWRAESATCMKTLMADTGGVSSVCAVRVAGGSWLLATAGRDGSVRLWSPSEHRRVASEESIGLGRTVLLTAPGTRQAGKRLYSLSESGELRAWDPSTGELTKKWRSVNSDRKAPLLITDWSRSPWLVYAEKYGELGLWEMRDSAEFSYYSRADVRQFHGSTIGCHFSTVTAIAASPKDPSLAAPAITSQVFLCSAGADGTLRRWRFADLKLDGAVSNVGRPVRAMCVIYPDSMRDDVLIVGGSDERVRLFSFNTLEELSVLTSHRHPITSIVPLQARGQAPIVASVSADRELRVWDIAAQKTVGSIDMQGAWLNAATPLTGKGGNPLIATGGGDRIVRVWDLRGTQVMEIPVRHEVIDMSAAGSRLFLGLTSGLMALDIDETSLPN
ncbi:trypsin-like peptidase domain-containing protein [Actinospica sp. MGRD01-02]|uniref:Trypsin-like peptidase domain-containing protein n=1 Tax=Actinospica acidithermotolerans TaxID=2828514 RepID=A0A941IGQ5_9ACTN|nr:trypsin-like peptidase domain-containing protein [Actinospica acidithermotolerans]MBR7826394.1 trypsin-like peptidase domain-containing protein [Actinospica acidithermotolerans]